MVFDVVTLFPGLFSGGLQESILGRARRAGKVGVRLHDLRRWGIGKHRQVDDAPYGGGGGMILRPEPFFEAVDWVRREYPATRERVVFLSPQGRQARAMRQFLFDPCHELPGHELPAWHIE